MSSRAVEHPRGTRDSVQQQLLCPEPNARELIVGVSRIVLSVVRFQLGNDVRPVRTSQRVSAIIGELHHLLEASKCILPRHRINLISNDFMAHEPMILPMPAITLRKALPLLSMMVAQKPLGCCMFRCIDQ